MNAWALMALAYYAMLARQKIESRLHETQYGKPLNSTSQFAAHTALNVVLCPVIFFFSGLYYTDVVSTAVVVACLVNSLDRLGKQGHSIRSDFYTIGLGLLALFMRQTNIFWVVVFLGCVEGIDAVKTLQPSKVHRPSPTTLTAQVKFFAWRYSVGDVHDPPVHMAWPDGKLL